MKNIKSPNNDLMTVEKNPYKFITKVTGSYLSAQNPLCMARLFCHVILMAVEITT